MSPVPHNLRALPAPRGPLAAAVALLALALCGCASSVSTGNFKGAEHEVAQAVADLQTDASAGEASKICANDLDAALVARLGGRDGCETAIKNQLAETDNLELSVESVKLGPSGDTATAGVKSIKGGKSTPGTLALVKEDGKWRISGLQ